MSSLVDRDSEAAFAMAWRAFADRIIAGWRMYRMRRRHRRELLDYLASDHRAAADIGVTPCEAKLWAERPFWHR
ncbi:MAG TPA: hypothetical protein VEF90_07145 [Xanthobacteraceae bacterium]|nr:hypothetical protein [Xanthobacteraceae bacterium]